jgi:predicted sugar kinase
LEDEVGRLHGAVGLKNEQIYNLEAKLRAYEASAVETAAARKALFEKDQLLKTIDAEKSNYEIRIRSLSKEV